MKKYYSKIEVDGRCVNLLLTETEVVKAHKRAIADSEKHGITESMYGVCWPTAQPPKCSLWDRIMGRCDCDNKKENHEQS